MNTTGNIKMMRNGRYKGSIQEKRDRLAFQKEIAEVLKIARKARLWVKDTKTIDHLIGTIADEFKKEKLAIERDY